MKIIFLFLLLPFSVFAQGVSTGLSSLNLPTTPFTVSTAHSFVSNPGNIQSVRINPANISALESYNILLSHTEWIIDSKIEYFAVGIPSSYGSFLFSFANTSINEIEIREIPGHAIGTFNFQSSVFQLTYGNEIYEDLRIGASTKYLYEKNYVDESTGYAFDFGALFITPINNLTVGASITNIGSMSKFRKEKIELPSYIRLGATYQLDLDYVTFRSASSISTGLQNSINHVSFGLELMIEKLIALRFGYETGYAVRSFAGGIGIKYNILTLDYAFIPFTKQAGNSHAISIGFIL